jgi:hypothetical protein
VSSHVYEIIKTIYSTTTSESTDSDRVSVLQATLIQLRLANIATLDALMTHFTRLIELTSADETYVAALAHNLAPSILRPRTESSMSMEEKHSYRLIRDLFAHKNAIFGELKRASSLSHSASINEIRPRAISTDESNRKANMEARNRAILAAGGSRSRATSPAPGPRGHRRDRSSGGPETRFPVAPSPTVAAELKKVHNPPAAARNSLEIPGSTEASPIIDGHIGAPLQSITNGSGEHTATYSDGTEGEAGMGRTSHVATARMGQARRPTPGVARQSLGKSEVVEHRPMGVSLTDRPMDD